MAFLLLSQLLKANAVVFKPPNSELFGYCLLYTSESKAHINKHTAYKRNSNT